MNVTDPVVLASDVLVMRVSDLAPPVRDEIGDSGAFAVTRAHGRSPSLLLDEASAGLLGEFREPSTIVDAVIRYGRRVEVDPEEILTESYPALRRFLAGGYLVASSASGPSSHRLTFAVGERVAGGAVVRCVRMLEDSEVYQLALDGGGLAALKVVRVDRSVDARDRLRREADVLARLDGRVAPRPLDSGEAGGTPWLSMEWCDGVPIATAAAALRRARRPAPELFDLCRGVVNAYAALHDLGVVHADVHPGNVLSSPAGDVRVVDFGLARVVDGSGTDDEPARGGVTAFLDPQYASAVRSQQLPPPASTASDQYALGAMLYRLVTGSDYLDFSIVKDEMLRQIVEDEPLPFTRRGHPSWPDMEALLATALSKEPARRFSSTAVMAQSLAAVGLPGSPAAPGPPKPAAALEMLLGEVLDRARPGGGWFEGGLPAAPFCSVAYGAAGVGAALCRVAMQRADPELLTLADEWTVRAARESDRTGAFDSDELQLSEARTGPISPFHRSAGVHAVQVLVSHALGDALARQQALDAFVEASRRPCEGIDLTLGRSGTVLVGSLLLETIGAAPYTDTSGLITLGNEVLAGVWEEIGGFPPIADGGPVTHLGVAHGWAGLLLSALRWCRSAASPLPAGVEDRLAELADLARFEGLGARWAWKHDPSRRGPAPSMPGWCNGTAGFVHLWTTAHATLRDARWATLAERAAWDTYTTPSPIGQLCCGLSGQAYALLEMYNHSGERRWLTAAAELGAKAAALAGRESRPTTAGSLHKGDLGIATLAADLAEPEAATMPFFGWGNR